MTPALLARARGLLGLERPIVANTSWQFADRLVRIGVGFLVGVWTVRYLGPEAFGRLSYALALAAILMPLANLGIEPILVRELVGRPGDRGRILGTAWALRVVGGLVAVLALLGVAGILRLDRGLVALVAIAGSALVLQSFEVIESWFQSRLESRYVAVSRTAAVVLAAAARVAFILLGLSVVAFAWAGWIEAALVAVALVVVGRLAGGAVLGWRIDRAEAGRLLRDSWPFIFSNAMIMLYMRIDQLMIAGMVGTRELGVYSVAVRMTEVWYMIPMAVASSVFPSIVRARTQGDDVFHARLQRLYDVMAVAGYAVALPLTLLAPWLVRTAFGADYAGAVLPLQILIWTVLFTNLGVARSSYLTAMNRAGLHLVTVTIGAAVNIVLNLVLIPRHGAVGAAIATVAAQWVAAHGTCFVVPALRPTGVMLTRALIAPRLKRP